jgi:hypothetical protein
VKYNPATLFLKQLKKLDVMFKTFKSIYVELGPTVAGSQQINFPDISELRSAPVFKIQTYNPSSLALTFFGKQTPAPADFAKAFITLYFQGGEFIREPLQNFVTLRDTATTTTNFPFQQSEYLMNGQVIVWTKSYITFGNTTGLTAGRFFHFNIYYTDK